MIEKSKKLDQYHSLLYNFQLLLNPVKFKNSKMHWEKLDSNEIKKEVFNALKQNVDFRNELIFGVPASHLDSNVFYDDAPFLKDAPFLSAMISNPNHIGCHTLGDSEVFFKGTHQLEKKVIKICAEQILKSPKEQYDGYVASGGTEANLQAYWMYRNYFKKEFEADSNEIALLCTNDSHYSVNKGVNILGVHLSLIHVDENDRKYDKISIEKAIEKSLAEGIRYFIVQVNMATTMFGSVDDIDLIVEVLQEKKVHFKVHVDGAFGGFIYPFTTDENKLTFENSYISSFTLDAHKMLQAPYGTGIFLCRKNLLKYVYTEEAQYVNGMDITLSGSRSGANAIAVWMILMTYGKSGWKNKIKKLVENTNWLCEQLDLLGIEYYRYEHMNIVSIKSHDISSRVALRYGLVPDSHQQEVSWWKIVVMEHVTLQEITKFIDDLKKEPSLI